MNKELVKEEMAHKFWNEINEAKWENTPTDDVDEWVEKRVKEACNVFHCQDLRDMVAIFEICKTIAGRFAYVSCVSCGITKIFEGSIKWDYLAFGWGDPHVTGDYGYAYFDFAKGMVFIDTFEGGSDVYGFSEILKMLYS